MVNLALARCAYRHCNSPRAVNITNIFQRCDSDVVTMTFYGKIILLL